MLVSAFPAIVVARLEIPAELSDTVFVKSTLPEFPSIEITLVCLLHPIPKFPTPADQALCPMTQVLLPVVSEAVELF